MATSASYCWQVFLSLVSTCLIAFGDSSPWSCAASTSFCAAWPYQTYIYVEQYRGPRLFESSPLEQATLVVTPEVEPN